MPYSLRGVTAEDIPRIWPNVAPLLANALSRNARGITLQIVRETLIAREASLWLVVEGETTIRAAVVWYPDPQTDSLVVWLLAGSGMAEWLDMLIEGLVFHVKHCGFSALSAAVRPGLARILGRKGWTVEHITMRMPLHGRTSRRQGRPEHAHDDERGDATAVAH